MNRIEKKIMFRYYISLGFIVFFAFFFSRLPHFPCRVVLRPSASSTPVVLFASAKESDSFASVKESDSFASVKESDFLVPVKESDFFVPVKESDFVPVPQDDSHCFLAER